MIGHHGQAIHTGMRVNGHRLFLLTQRKYVSALIAQRAFVVKHRVATHRAVGVGNKQRAVFHKGKHFIDCFGEGNLVYLLMFFIVKAQFTVAYLHHLFAVGQQHNGV